MVPPRTYTDEELFEAVAVSKSWRSTLRCLGLQATSSSAIRSVRAHAERLGLDCSHFTGQRRWTEEQLRRAAVSAQDWTEVAGQLGLRGGSAVSTLKSHASRLDINTAHLTSLATKVQMDTQQPRRNNLSRAGSMLAAAWFTLCGRAVSCPLEPSRYDLLVCVGSDVRRVQVKTTTVKSGTSWKAFLSTTRRERVPYAPDEIDDFFVIDGDLNYYLIPMSAVGGLHAIHLNAYESFRVESRL